ncbi:zinc finger protein 878-like [Cheilinus undulatus]|uniref:zinc finger protein 878-like n=1 Tax=Cheilinus undulatus TaxID=241271 RepID=UPI001BD2419E|nr:zinc finger protein 878-like [Cheilinus undulatus]
MSDQLVREFRALLSTTMDTVLRRAMFEIMKLFESSLHDHQLELAHKGEEIVQLKIKLQRAEVRLRDSVGTSDERGEMSVIQTNETQRETGDDPNAPAQPSAAPEIDYEVPGDWCAPLGCETLAKPDEGECPSVRLRQLSIPLWHIPIKQEDAHQLIESHRRTKGVRRSKRGSSSNVKGDQTLDKTLVKRDRKGPPPKVRGDINRLLHENAKTDALGPRRRGQDSTGTKQETTLMGREDGKTAATKSKPEEKESAKKESKDMYTCRFCKKAFDSPFGRNVHMRFHKWCRGCKKVFPFPSALNSHKPQCGKLRRIMAKEALTSITEKRQSRNEETKTIKKPLIIKKESTPSSSNHTASSNETDKQYSCLQCDAKFKWPFKLEEHMRIHTGEKPFSCSICSRKFRVNQFLKLHMLRKHKIQEDSGGANGDLSWTEPLEDTEELNSQDKETNAPTNHINVKTEPVVYIGPSLAWKECGVRISGGFSCKLCSKVKKTKYQLVEHFRVHTGEKPFKCTKCHACFRFRGQLSIHTKQCNQSKIHCEKCGKKFLEQKKYDQHMCTHQKERPHRCKVCGKGFITKGYLRSHMVRCH